MSTSFLHVSKSKCFNFMIVPYSIRGKNLIVSVCVWVLQEVDESGGEVFTVVLPSGTPLPARRHHMLSGDGNLSSLCVEIYQRFFTEQPKKLAKVQKNVSVCVSILIHISPTCPLWVVLYLLQPQGLYQSPGSPSNGY